MGEQGRGLRLHFTCICWRCTANLRSRKGRAKGPAPVFHPFLSGGTGAPAICLPAPARGIMPSSQGAAGRDIVSAAANPFETDIDKNAANYVPLSPLGF